ncbi:MAG: SufS family cysteine desulfurase [Solirubrobacterales bacterium]|nr:SufS family cysteine desulfurase [Solirubrobacterales bacterium]MBV9941134.1 SufS family cysteine desulfurase [Solirubrobacterales bacterium]
MTAVSSQASGRTSGGFGVSGEEVAAQFPVLRNRSFDGRPVVYLDSSATSQTPDAVIDAMTSYYTQSRASIHRGVYPLAAEATDLYEGARTRIASWLGSSPQETIFAANATAAINMVAYTWGRQNVQRGDLVVLTEMEHHSNIVPWQLLCQDREAELAYVPVTSDGFLDMEALDSLLARGPRLVGVVHVSNVLGTVNPVASIARRAHACGAVVLVDGTQAVPQLPVWLPELDVDFYAWTGHKAYGPTGIGVLHGRRALLEEMPPFIGGGHMIRTVAANESTWTDLPWKFEAGTSQIAEAIGLGAAVDWIQGLGMPSIRAHEQALVAELLERLVSLPEVPGVTVQGPLAAADRGALVSFTLDGAHPHDIADILGSSGVCVRAGHHCAQPLMRRLGVPATTRASFAVHNSPGDVDRLVEGLGRVRSTLRLD